MYEEFFGLKEKPFSSVPDTSFLFKGSQYREAYNHLLYGIRAGEGFMLITGEAGTGKTTLCRALLHRLGGHIETALVLNPPATPVELLQSILQDLGCRDAAGTTRKKLLDTLNAHLLRCASRGKPVVVIVDEAQDLSMEILEEIRLLSNFETEKSKLIQIVLAGQPSLLNKLTSPALQQLYQRIAVHYRLKPLDESELDSYIRFRMLRAGSCGDVGFTRRAVRRIYQCSQGFPRRVNQVCDKGLLAGYVARTSTITESMVQEAVESVYCTETLPARRRWKAGAGAAALMLAFGAAFLMSGGRGHPPQKHTGPAPRRAAQPPAPADAPAVPRDPGAHLPGDGGGDAVREASGVPEALPSGGEAFLRGVGPEEAFALTQRDEGLIQEGFDGDGVFRSAGNTQCAREALATALNLWGLPRQSLLRAFEHWGRKGPRFSFYDSVRELGLQVLVRPRSRLDRIAAMGYPCIVPVDDDRLRYVVLAGIRDDEIILLDPRSGRRTVSPERFEEIWTGRVFYVWKDLDGLPPVLKAADVHEKVATVRQHLSRLGYGVSGTADLFDPDLERAVKRFQADRGLEADGVLEGLTKMVLYREIYRKRLPGLGAAAARVTAQAAGPAMQGRFDEDGILRPSGPGRCAREALGTLLRLWGVPEPSVVEKTVSWKPGSTFKEAASEFGFRVSAMTSDLGQVGTLNYPCIVWLQEARPHYAVLSGLKSGRALLMDPLYGLRIMTGGELAEMWSGQAIYVWNDFDGLPAGLKRGDVHSDVVVLKGRMEELGFAVSDPFSEVFDHELERNVKRLQSQFELEADGILGNRTLMVIYRALFGGRLPALKAFAPDDLLVSQPSAREPYPDISGTGRL